MRRIFVWLGTPATVLAIASCGQSRYTADYQIPYDQAEHRLLTRVKLDKAKLLWRPGQPRTDRIGPAVYADNRLESYLTMKIYNSIVLHRYEKGKHLAFTASHKYDILGTGSQSISFELTKTGEKSTSISLDFSDQSLSFYLIPAWNEGGSREREIAREIFGPLP